MKVVERDLLILAMIREFSHKKLNELIPNIDLESLSQLHESTFNNNGSLNDMIKQLANETYGKVKKKFVK